MLRRKILMVCVRSNPPKREPRLMYLAVQLREKRTKRRKFSSINAKPQNLTPHYFETLSVYGVLPDRKTLAPNGRSTSPISWTSSVVTSRISFLNTMLVGSFRRSFAGAGLPNGTRLPQSSRGRSRTCQRANTQRCVLPCVLYKALEC